MHADRNLRVQVTVTDVHGRRFDNFSSLALEWELDSTHLTSLEDHSGVETEVPETSGYRQTLGKNTFHCLCENSLVDRCCTTVPSPVNNNIMNIQSLLLEINIV